MTTETRKMMPASSEARKEMLHRLATDFHERLMNVDITPEERYQVGCAVAVGLVASFNDLGGRDMALAAKDGLIRLLDKQFPALLGVTTEPP